MTIFACSRSLGASDEAEVFKSKETNFNTTSGADAFSSQFLETDSYSRRLGKKQQSAAAGGILERLGVYLVKSFRAWWDSIRHLLAEKGREADEAGALSLSRNVEHGDVVSATTPNDRPDESSALTQEGEPEASVRDVLRREWREMGKGLNALYLFGYGQSVPAGALRALMADKELGTARVEAFEAQLMSARMALRTTDRAMTLKEVINAFGSKGFRAPIHALAAFVGGMTSFADSFASEYAKAYGEDCLRVAPDSCVQEFVSKHLKGLDEGQEEQLSGRMLTWMSKRAQHIFTFAYEQVELSGHSKLGDKLSQLGFGVRVLDALREYLKLEPMPSIKMVSVDDLDIHELAALDRVLKRV